MTNTFFFSALFPLLFFSCRSPDVGKSADARPNILFILTDDHAYQAISAYDSTLIHTPNIDRLAKEGMRFDRAYVTNSICAPSRAVALTGKFSHLNGVRDNAQRFDSSQVTVPKLLQQAGYQTAVIGKWHLKSNPTGFDYWRILIDQGDYYHPEFITPSGIDSTDGYATDVITDMAIGFLDSLRDKSKPFMLMYQHKAPHRHWWPPMNQLHAFKDKPLPEPSSLFDDYSHRGRAAHEAEMRISDHMALTADNKLDPEAVKKLGYKEFMPWYEENYNREYRRLSEDERQKWDEVYGPIQDEFVQKKLTGDTLTKWKYQRYLQDYLACILSVDENIGRLMDYLKKEGLLENTMIIYTSDQGFYLGEHGWFDKRFMYEESFRTPLIIRWPGHIQPGSTNRDLVQNIDYAPTILSAAGVGVPADMQGMSLLPLFQPQHDTWRDALYYHYYEYPGIHQAKRHYGIRTDRYKLIHFYYDVDEWELYDLEKDPHEMNNVIDDPTYADTRRRLESRLHELQQQYQDPDDLREQILKDDLARMHISK